MTRGQRIQKLRTDNSLSQEGFAAILGVSRQSVSKWEADKAFPEIDKLALMTEKFGVSCDYIILGEDVLEEDKQETKRDVTLSRGLFRTMIFLLSALSVLCAVLATMLVLPIL